MTGPVVRGKFPRPVDRAAVAADWRARGYSCDLFVDPPGREWNDFVHTTNELVTIAEGRLELTVGEVRLIAEPCDEALIPRGAFHSVKSSHRHHPLALRLRLMRTGRPMRRIEIGFARWWLPVVALLAGWALQGCITPALPETGIDDPTPAKFPYCRDNTCETIKKLSFDPAEWAAVTAPLGEPAADAASERVHIAETVAVFEQRAGAKAGTTTDIGGTIKGTFRPGQLDCIDETSNTNTLLGMLEKDGLFHWHRRGAHATRLVIISDGVPHFTATVVEIASGQIYAVDSWFRDNGSLADVVPLEVWQDGWNPE